MKPVAPPAQPSSEIKDDSRTKADAWPQLWLEQEHLGEASPAAVAARDGLASAERERLAGALGELAADDQAIFKDYPPQWVAQKIADRRRREPSKSRPLANYGWRMAVPLAAMAALVLIVVRPGSDEKDPSPLSAQIDTPHDAGDGREVTRAKGLMPHVVVYRQLGREVSRVQAQDELAAHAVVQLAYVAADCVAGAIVSLDGAGQVTLHFPQSAAAITALNHSGGEVLLPEAYELDDAPDFERFILVCAKKAQGFSAESVVKAAEKMVASGNRQDWSQRALEVPAAWRQASFVIRKESKR